MESLLPFVIIIVVIAIMQINLLTSRNRAFDQGLNLFFGTVAIVASLNFIVRGQVLGGFTFMFYSIYYLRRPFEYFLRRNEVEEES